MKLFFSQSRLIKSVVAKRATNNSLGCKMIQDDRNLRTSIIISKKYVLMKLSRLRSVK